MKEEIKTLVVTRGIILNKDNPNKILLLKRAANRAYNPNKWELPGSKVKYGKNLYQSLESAIAIETGLIVKANSTYQYCSSSHITEQGKYQNYIYIEITLATEEIGGDIKLGGDNIKHEWVEIQKIFNFDLSLESKDTLANYISTRKESESKAPVFISGKVLIKNNKNQYLMVKRSKEGSYANKWELPGGKINSLETLVESVKREVFEETGCIIGEVKPSVNIQSQIAQEGKHRGSTYITIINEAKITAGKVTLGPAHHAFKWCSVDEIFKLDLALYIKIGLTEIFLKTGNKTKKH